MTIEDSAGVERLNRVYERYVKPLEHEHRGEYALVMPDGQVFFAPCMEALMESTAHVPDGGNSVFKVGLISAFQIL